jgi:hypothetical protein
MNIWKIIAYICVAGILVVAVLWLADGREIYTKTGQQVIEKDELWGTSEVKWVPNFQLGLLPSTMSVSREAVSALPLAGLFAVVGLIAFRMSRRTVVSS